MKKILVIGNSLNGALFESLEKYTHQLIDNIIFDFFTINGRALTSHAKVSPLHFPDSDVTKIAFRPTKTPQDGEVFWYSGTHGLIKDKFKLLDISSYSGIIVNEILLWSMYTYLFREGFYLPSAFQCVHKSSELIDHTPISKSLYFDHIIRYKKHSFELLSFIKKYHPFHPVFITPLTMPRKDQVDYSRHCRSQVRYELDSISEYIRDQFGYIVSQPPAEAFEDKFTISREYTTGDIHHYNSNYSDLYLNQSDFTNFIQSMS